MNWCKCTDCHSIHDKGSRKWIKILGLEYSSCPECKSILTEPKFQVPLL